MSTLLEQASLVMIPSGYKEDVVYSQIPTSGAGDLSFTRASNGTRINSAGLVEVCPWNLLQYSEDFANGVWVQDNNIITSNSIIAPNGTTTGETISNSATTALFRTYQYISGYGQPQTLTFSTYFKYKDHRYISFGLTDDSDYRSQVVVDLQNMVITENYKFFSGDVLTSSIENVGNGWYRIVGTFTYNTALAGGNLYLLYKFQTSGTFSSLGTFQTGTGVYIWGAQLNIGSTAKPYFPTTDRLNVPRLTYQNGGGGCPSLLLEKQSTNLFPNSQTTNAWSLTNMSRTANYGISPDGTQNADLLFPTTSGSVLFTTDTTTSSLVIGEPFVVSFFIKLNASFISNVGTNIFDIRLSGASVWSRPTIRVNLETGEVTNQNNASYISSTNFGNGWFRITFGATPTGTSGVVALQAPTGSTMNGGSFYIWGLQGEANATYATSYIPTTSSSATRVADAFALKDITSFSIGNAYTILLDVTMQSSDNNKLFFETRTSTNATSLTARNFNGALRLFNNIDASYPLAAVSSSTNKWVVRINGTSYDLFAVSGGIATKDSATITTARNFGYFELAGSTTQLYFDELVIFPTALTDAECQSLVL